jgi:hypothetical protein
MGKSWGIVVLQCVVEVSSNVWFMGSAGRAGGADDGPQLRGFRRASDWLLPRPWPEAKTMEVRIPLHASSFMRENSVHGYDVALLAIKTPFRSSVSRDIAETAEMIHRHLLNNSMQSNTVYSQTHANSIRSEAGDPLML